jgi:hypothetical protein
LKNDQKERSLLAEELVVDAVFEHLGDSFHQLRATLVDAINLIGLDEFAHEDVILSFAGLPFLPPDR